MFHNATSAPLSLPFKVIIYRHWKETERASNTAKLIAETLHPVQIIDYGIDEVNTPYFDTKDAVLLYPPEDQSDSTPPPSPIKTRILVDGTWKQVRKMMGRIPNLRALPRISVTAQAVPYPRLRTPSVPGGLSTVEAMASVLLHQGLIEAESRLRRANWALLNHLRQKSGIRHPLVPGLSFTDLRKLDNKYEI